MCGYMYSIMHGCSGYSVLCDIGDVGMYDACTLYSML